jgi:hypothetical protein
MAAPQMRTPGGNRASAGHEAADAAIVGQADAEHKAEATLRAELALRGHSLHRLANGGFLVSMCSLSRELPDLRAVRQFAKQVGVL